MRIGVISQGGRGRVFQLFADTLKRNSRSQLLEWISLYTIFFLMEHTHLGTQNLPTQGKLPVDGGRRGSVERNDGACAPLDTGVTKTSIDLASCGANWIPLEVLPSLSNTSKIRTADIALNTG